MSENQEKLLEKLKNFIQMEYTSVRFSHPVHPSNPRDSFPRIVFIEEGDPLLRIGYDNENHDIKISCGSAIYGMGGSSTGISFQQQECKTFVVCFFPEYIRIAAYEFCAAEKGGQILHFHTNKPLSLAGRAVLEALNQFGKQPETNGCTHFLIRALLQMTYSMLKKGENDKNVGKSERSWHQIEKYLETHLEKDLSRKKVAKTFLMNQSYLSTLCKQHTGKGFNEYVRDLRLSQAALLLELNLSLDEISESCGFRYTSYFIRLFKARYGISPGKFRLC